MTQTATAKLGYLTAFHLPSGTVAWSKLIYHYYNFWNYVPAVNKGVIYVGGDTAMYAFNATTGRKIWETLVSGVPLFNEVTVNGSMVYADDYYGGTVYAFDAGSGAIVWSAKPSGCCLIGPVSIANGLAYVGSDPVTVYNATTGAPEFSLPSSTSTVSVPVSGGKAFVQTVDHLEAYDAGTGVLLWSSPTVSGNSYSSLSPAVDGSTVVVSTPQNVIAFDTSTGSRLWTVDGGASDADFADPAIANGMVYVGSLTNGLQAFDEATGTVLYTGGSDCGSPIISDAAVYSFCSDVMTVFTL